MEEAGSSVGGIVVPHVDKVNRSITAELRQRRSIADWKAGTKRQRRTRDGGNAAVVLERVIARVFLPAGVKDTEFIAARCDSESRLPLISRGRVIVDLDWGIPC